MKRAILPLIAALAAVSASHAARVTVVPIVHQKTWMYQAYRGSSRMNAPAQMGFAGAGDGCEDTIKAVPGVLSIVPGAKWANFVTAANQTPAVPYAVKNVVLQKEAPDPTQCADVFSAVSIRQQGTSDIRLWWPLAYEAPGTVWTLSILYGTPKLFDDDGPGGPNPPSYVHSEVWQWEIEVTLDSLKNLVELFHEVPFGKSETPLISDERAYANLRGLLEEIEVLTIIGDTVAAGFALADFEMTVMDGCLFAPPASPKPSGIGTGIAQTEENPACCKLLADAAHLGIKLDIYQPVKQ